MTYALIVVPFVLVTVGVVAATARRPRFARRMAASGLAAGVLVVLTAVFDNTIVGAGIVAYPEGTSSGVRIGLAPIEDFSYAICAAFLVPAIVTLLTRRREAA